MTTDFGIYVHTPWCRTRCPYCAFNVFLHHSSDYDRWQQGILAAWESVSKRMQGTAHSLYFGGGTPSLAPPKVVGEIVEALPLQAGAEITLEVNPGTIDAAGLQAFHNVGVNRVSLGIQTFHSGHAKTLGRGHTAMQAQELLQLVPAIGFNSWSMDLMFALPNQTESNLRQDLEMMGHFQPPHVSIYGLSIEPGTPFETAHKSGRLNLPTADRWRNMYDLVVEGLEAMGLGRYEVSNFARPGHRAVHNEQVWRGGYYAGLGPGSHGHLLDGTRTLGIPTIEEWFVDPHPMESMPSKKEAAIDYLLSSLRHINGSNRALLRQRTGHDVSQKDIDNLCKQSLLVDRNDHMRLTHDAFPLADRILCTLIDGIAPTNSLDV